MPTRSATPCWTSAPSANASSSSSGRQSWRPRKAKTNRAVDRRILGSIVFKNPEALEAVEAILHPQMRRTFEKAIDRAAENQAKAVVIDAALLYEAGWHGLCDFVMFVDAPLEARIARVAATRRLRTKRCCGNASRRSGRSPGKGPGRPGARQ